MKTPALTYLASIVCIAILGACDNTQSKPSEPAPLFRTVAEGRIATDGGESRGVAWGDYDGDGDPDLYVANAGGQWNFLYRNEGNGKFKKIVSQLFPAAETVIHGGNSQGVNWVDYDNDGDLDLYVVSRGEEPCLLFRNEGTEGFTRIMDHPLTAPGISASMACWADYDLDGDLDVFLAGYSHPNLLFNNLGDGQFERVENTPVTENVEGRARACSCGDANDDRLPELYVANARTPNLYFRNLGNWQFEQVTEGHLVEDIGYSYGVSWADYDQDGYLDLFVANFDKLNFLYQNDGKGKLEPVLSGILAEETGGASKGHSWGDYDNNGHLDLYIGNGTYGPDMRNFLFMNQGNGSFLKDTIGEYMQHADTSAGVAHADYDRDGDLDLFVANWGGRDQLNRLYENVSARGNWITVRLTGHTSNSFGVGSKVIVYQSSGRQFRWMYPITGYGSQNDYELHFGLGEYTSIDSLVVLWPSGVRDCHKNPAINTHWMVSEGGSLISIR